MRPLLGINSGSLGYLTDSPAAQLEEALQRVLAGQYRLDPRMLLEAHYHPHDGQPLRFRGLNDVVLSHGPLARVVDVSLRASDVALGSTLADGVIVSTPSGSTAYNLSAGGPIVSPELRALILTPINAHTLSMRPLVVAADEGVEVQLKSTAAQRVQLTVDGWTGCEVQEGERIVVRSAPRDLQMVVTREGNFYETLRTKLSWGRRGMGDASPDASKS
jgi:NAD+ kinase